MNILAIDYGTKRIGLAWMQEGLDVVLPFGVIRQQTTNDGLQQLARLVQEEKIDKVILGLPVHLETGEETENSKRVREFGDALKEKTGLPVEYVDERLTSFEADQMGGDASRDEKAAMVILEAYRSSKP